MKRWLLLLELACGCAAPASSPIPLAKQHAAQRSAKINGVAITASSVPMEKNTLSIVYDANANYVCFLPFAFVRTGEPAVHYNSLFQEWGERPEGIADCIRMAHASGLKVMVKPQLWIGDNGYTGNLSYNSEDEWKKFEKDYTKYIFSLLTAAESEHAEIFCIGTELNSFINQQPDYWNRLIDTIKQGYHGKLTYAENWDCYDRVSFWKKMDYIGISAYFPLSGLKSPSIDDLKKAWQKNVVALKSFSEVENKPVLFTEYGYRSIDYCCAKPWDSYTHANSNLIAQANAYTALYESFWNQPWFAGGFSWKWFDEHSSGDVPMETEYTPQGKPAMEVLKKWYSK